MAEAREFVRKMNIVSTKDREDKADDASNDANKNVRIVCDILDAYCIPLCAVNIACFIKK